MSLVIAASGLSSRRLSGHSRHRASPHPGRSIPIGPAALSRRQWIFIPAKKNGAANKTTAPRRSPWEDIPNAPRASARARDLNPPADRLWAELPWENRVTRLSTPLPNAKRTMVRTKSPSRRRPLLSHLSRRVSGNFGSALDVSRPV